MCARLIETMFEAIDDAAWDRLACHFSPDVVYHRPGYEPIRGLRELDHFYRNVRIIARGQHHIDHIVHGNGLAACWGSFEGLARDGCPLRERFADVYSFASGLICSRTTYFYRAAI